MTAVLQMPKGRLMTSPEKLKEFKADFETVRASRQAAQEYIEAEDAKATAEASMRRTWKAVVECGTALKRMHDTESYLEHHKNWSELCKALKIPRNTSYRLMASAETLAKGAPTPVAKVEAPLTIVPAPTATPDVEEPDEAEAPTTETDEKLAKLRELLRSSPQQQVNEAEAPAKPKNEQDASWVKRQAASLLRWFESKNLRDQVASHINALIELADRAV